MSAGQPTGSWTLQTGLAEWGSQPRAKWRSSSWRTKSQVSISALFLFIVILSLLLAGHFVNFPCPFLQESCLHKRQWQSIPTLQWKQSVTPAATLFLGYRTTAVSFQGQRLLVCRRWIIVLLFCCLQVAALSSESALETEETPLTSMWLYRIISSKQVVSEVTRIKKKKSVFACVALFNHIWYLESLKIRLKKSDSFCFVKCWCALIISVCVFGFSAGGWNKRTKSVKMHI